MSTTPDTVIVRLIEFEPQMSLEELAEHLQVLPETVVALTERDGLPHHLYGRKRDRLRFVPSEVAAWLLSLSPGNPPPHPAA